MEKSKVICKTDADRLLDFVFLENDGYAYSFVKEENGKSNKYVNVNEKLFGPYKMVILDQRDGKANWGAWTEEEKLKFSDNGQKCESYGKILGNGITQKDLDWAAKVDSDAKAREPEEEYDERTHILKLNKKQQDFFVTNTKKYGPYYVIFNAIYQDDEHFQFTFMKEGITTEWYYNLNGQVTGPFPAHQKMTPPYFIKYTESGKAVVDNSFEDNFVLVDGKKVECFKEKHTHCAYYEINGHEIIAGRDSNGNTNFKRDGIEYNFPTLDRYYLDNGDIVYIKKDEEFETWFYNDSQISVTIQGHDSSIIDNIITYRRTENEHVIPYFMMRGKEYNGTKVRDFKKGFCWLENKQIKFFSYNFYDYHNLYDGLDETIIRNGNFTRLYNLKQLAGRD